MSIARGSRAIKTAAFIFDVDGTLAETEESHRHAFNATFAAAGLDWHWDPTLYGELLKVTDGKELTPGMRCPKRESRFSTAKRRKLTPISSHVEAFA
jgi:phosphoglycolate phosphatase-like HAD superfamily hydrolase